ncbi:MAG: YjjG family noncanonical pyrimidine nucleotidase [Sphaerochaetaceae bacterium]
MYDHLLFDLDGTLFDFMASEKYALTCLFEAAQLDITDTLLDDYHTINFRLWKELEEGSITIDALKIERFRLFFESKQIDFSAESACELYLHYLSQSHHVYEDTMEVLHQIKDMGILMSVITNGIRSVQRGRLARTETAQFFSFIAIGEELKAAKPDPLFFERTLEGIRKLGIPVSNALVIGDSLSSDIEGAKNGNLDSCWINRYGMTEPCIKDYTYHITGLKQLLDII